MGVTEPGPREVRICDCGAVVEMTDRVCPNCGRDMEVEEEGGEPGSE